MLELIVNWNDKTSLSTSSCLSKRFAVTAYKLSAVKRAVNSAGGIENDFD